MPFEINTSTRNLSVVLSGSYDLSESSSFKQQYEQLMSTEIATVRLIAIDLTYIDSSGVASLLFMRKLASRFNANFIFQSVSDPAARVISLANLGAILGLPKAEFSNEINNKNLIVNSIEPNRSPEFSDTEALAILRTDETFSSDVTIDEPLAKTINPTPESLTIRPGSFS
jgi:anti-anti-sigma factor